MLYIEFMELPPQCHPLHYIAESVILDLRRIVGNEAYVPKSPEDICSRVLTTVYMASENSSTHTRSLATHLSTQIGRSGHFLREHLMLHSFCSCVQESSFVSTVAITSSST